MEKSVFENFTVAEGLWLYGVFVSALSYIIYRKYLSRKYNYKEPFYKTIGAAFLFSMIFNWFLIPMILFGGIFCYKESAND